MQASQPLRIGLFGAGRVASQLAPALLAAGHELVFIGSRSSASAAALTAQLPSPPRVLPASATKEPLPAADLYLLAVPDAAVAELINQTQWPSGSTVAHVAGALPLQLQHAAHRPNLRTGVFYPLQTFSPGRAVAWNQVPLFVEGADQATEDLLLGLARSLSSQVQILDSAGRLQLHLAAVFANNFTNHLLGIAHQLLTDAGLPFRLLEPLIHETVDKACRQAPFSVQTGPAVRHDAPTLAAHEAALLARPGWQHLYRQLTASIQAQLATAKPNSEPLVADSAAPEQQPLRP